MSIPPFLKVWKWNIWGKVKVVRVTDLWYMTLNKNRWPIFNRFKPFHRPKSHQQVSEPPVREELKDRSRLDLGWDKYWKVQMRCNFHHGSTIFTTITEEINSVKFPSRRDAYNWPTRMQLSNFPYETIQRHIIWLFFTVFSSGQEAYNWPTRKCVHWTLSRVSCLSRQWCFKRTFMHFLLGLYKTVRVNKF